MPQIAALSINDGQVAPVAHTFGVVTTTGSKAEWAERSSLIPAGYLGITHEVRRPASATAAQRLVLGFNFPVLETVNGVSTVTRYSSAKLEMNFSNLSTEQERKDALAYVKNTLANAGVIDSIVKIEPFY